MDRSSLRSSLYAFTYHMNTLRSHKVLLSDFDPVIDFIKWKYTLINVTYELDKRDNAHIHGTILTDSGHPNLRLPGFNVYWSKIEPGQYHGWHQYIHKEYKYNQQNDNGYPLPYRILPIDPIMELE